MCPCGTSAHCLHGCWGGQSDTVKVADSGSKTDPPQPPLFYPLEVRNAFVGKGKSRVSLWAGLISDCPQQLAGVP